MKKVEQSTITRHINNTNTDVNTICFIKLDKDIFYLVVIRTGKSRVQYKLDDVYPYLKKSLVLLHSRHGYWIISTTQYKVMLKRYNALEWLPYTILKNEIENIKKDLLEKDIKKNKGAEDVKLFKFF